LLLIHPVPPNGAAIVLVAYASEESRPGPPGLIVRGQLKNAAALPLNSHDLSTPAEPAREPGPVRESQEL